MRRSKLEVADVFHRHGADWRCANAGHVSLGQLQVMSAIEQCRSAALGGHVERCEDCGHSRIAYNSCRNRRCPHPLERQRAGKHAGVGSRDLQRSVISRSLYSRTKESPDRLRTEIRIDQTKSEREGIMATEIWEGIR